MKIYIKNYNGEKDLSKFILDSFSEPYGGSPRIPHSIYKFVTTYSDPECTITQCSPARRSFDDLLDICKTYFPDTTDKILAKTLISLLKVPNRVFNVIYCGDINKVVFYKRVHSSNSDYRDVFRVFSRIYEKGLGNYSLNDIIALSNID